MFERDHIMRQVNQLAQALARAMSLRAESKQPEAISEIDQAIGLVVDDGWFDQSEEEIRNRLADPDDPFAIHAADLAALFEQKGNALAEMGAEDDATEARRRALIIYSAILDSGASSLPWDIRERIRRLEESIRDR